MDEPAVQKRRFLAIDDNSDSAELVARVAAKCGYEARWLADPRECLKLLREWLPDVITLDLCMPEEDGLTLVGALTESRFTGQLVIVSGQDGWIRKSARRLATARGLNVAEDFRKPVDIRAFGQFLTRLNAPSAPETEATRTQLTAEPGPV
ncbi:MAG TPA: response regulator [Stellaceae bacterium]|nr:response regulator [Stellaceae bacterium]